MLFGNEQSGGKVCGNGKEEDDEVVTGIVSIAVPLFCASGIITVCSLDETTGSCDISVSGTGTTRSEALFFFCSDIFFDTIGGAILFSCGSDVDKEDDALSITDISAREVASICAESLPNIVCIAEALK